MTFSNKYYEKTLDLDDFLDDSKTLLIDYICKLCGGVLYEACFDTCGHMYCGKCIRKSLDIKQICPVSGDQISISNLPTSFVNKIIEKRELYCRNKKNGCEWIGKAPQFEDHIKNDCRKQLLKCTYDACEQKIYREDLEEHLKVCEYRLIPCSHCEILISNILLTCHVNICPKMKLNCPLECGITIERKDLEEHTKSFCDNATVQCIYYNYGCEHKGPKKLSLNHSQTAVGEHSLMILKFVEGFNKNYHDKVMFFETFGVKVLNEEITKLEQAQKTKEEKDEKDANQILILKNKRLRIEDEDNKEEISESKEKEEFLKKVSSQIVDVPNPQITEKVLSQENDKLVQWEFNKALSSNSLVIEKNKVTCVSLTKNQHMFALIDKELNYKSCTWKVNLIKYSIWVAFGLCDRSRLITNKYVFTNPGNPLFNHGCFLLSSNYFLWNPNNQTENNKMVKKQRMEQGDCITMEYNHFTAELSFTINDSTYKLTNVKTNNPLVPCVILLTNGDEISID